MNETMTSVYSHQYRVVYVKFAIVFMTMVKSLICYNNEGKRQRCDIAKYSQYTTVLCVEPTSVEE